MSELSAASCGCDCSCDNGSNGNSCSCNLLWIILIFALLCGNGCDFCGNGGGLPFANLFSNGDGNCCCIWIIVLLLLCCCCNN